MSNELKDCPFCGSKPTLEDHRLMYSVDCKCGACALGEKAAEPDGSESIAFWADIQQSAIDKWNLRALAASGGNAAPVVANGTLPELPPLPETDVDGGYYDSESGFTKKVMQEYAVAYGQACAAASAPNAALVAALDGMLGAWNMVCDANGWERDHIQQQKDAVAALSAAGKEVGHG